MTAAPRRREIAVDMRSHSGLRGIAALWIVLFHNFYYSSLAEYVNLWGSVAMPLFFLMSGFSLSAVYGSSLSSGGGGGDGSSSSGCGGWWGSKLTFWRNRFARIYPTYFLTTLAAFPLVWTNCGLFPEETSRHFMSEPKAWAPWVTTNILLIQHWLLGVTAFPTVSFNPPAWFVSVLWFQYAVFPFTMLLYRCIHRRILWIALHVLATMGTSSAILFTTSDFNYATMNVLSPGFYMFHAGMICGCLCEERSKTVNEEEEEVEVEVEVEEEENNNAFHSTKDQRQYSWAICTDIATVLLVLWMFVCSILWGAGFRAPLVWASYFAQIFGTPLMVLMTMGLTLDGGKSYLAVLCRLKVSEFFGGIGMSLYLVHEIWLRWITYVISVTAPSQVYLVENGNINGMSMPWWAIFISVPTAILLGYIVERFFDAPCRKWLRGRKKATATQHQGEEKQQPTEHTDDKNGDLELTVPPEEATAEEEASKGGGN